MTDAREIIRIAAEDKLKFDGFSSYDEMAEHLIQALTAAGYRILGPDDVDQLERLAKGDIPGVWQEKFEKAQEIARALGRKA